MSYEEAWMLIKSTEYQHDPDKPLVFEVEDSPDPMDDEWPFRPEEFEGLPGDALPREVTYIVMAFVHLFSGARRPGDLQESLERVLITRPWTVIILSLDIALDPVLGDLTQQPIVDKWCGYLRTGRALGITGGPPCESWSAVRWNRLQDDSGSGPPPLRTYKHLWGRPDVTLRQHLQLFVGSQLLLSTHKLLMVCLQVGACGVAEHPEQAWWEPRAPSSWELDSAKAIAA